MQLHGLNRYTDSYRGAGGIRLLYTPGCKDIHLNAPLVTLDGWRTGQRRLLSYLARPSGLAHRSVARGRTPGRHAPHRRAACALPHRTRRPRRLRDVNVGASASRARHSTVAGVVGSPPPCGTISGMLGRDDPRSIESSAGVPRGDGILLSLLGGFELRAGAQAVSTLTHEAQHLLALLALRGRHVSRDAVAGTLWADASQAHANASLRSAVSRLSTLAHDAIVVSGVDLALAPDVVVDLHEARALAHRLLDAESVLRAEDLSAGAIEALSKDCLPDWYEDWAVLEAEEWRQLRLHALDALALRLAAAGRFGDAVAAALAALRAEPLRESACAVLIRVHLAEGNHAEAVRAFDQFRVQLVQELGVEPSPALRALLSASSESGAD